jgi:hypothetical protein
MPRLLSRYRIALPASAVVLILALLVAAQIALPSIAATHIRNMLKKNGQVLSVSVSAFPAIELLWHHAGSVHVRMATYHSGTGHLSSLLDQSSDVGTMTASVTRLTDGLLTLHDATLSKHGNTLTGTAQVELSDLQHAVPELTNVTPVASSDGKLTFDATGNIAGFGGTIPITVQPENGGIVGAPDLPIVGALFSLKVFSDPKITVESLGATKTPGGFSVSATGTLH